MKKLSILLVFVLFCCAPRELPYNNTFGFTVQTSPNQQIVTTLFRDEPIRFHITPNDTSIIDALTYQMEYKILSDNEGVFKNTEGPFLSDLKQDTLYPIVDGEAWLFTPLTVGEIDVDLTIRDNFENQETLQLSFQVAPIPFTVRLRSFTAGDDYIGVRITQESGQETSVPIYEVQYYLEITETSQIEKLVFDNTDNQEVVKNRRIKISTVNETLFKLETLAPGDHVLTLRISDEFEQEQIVSITIKK